jgi:hypothetical protein
MKNLFIRFVAIVLIGILLGSCGLGREMCPAYGQAKTVAIKTK